MIDKQMVKGFIKTHRILHHGKHGVILDAKQQAAFEDGWTACLDELEKAIKADKKMQKEITKELGLG